MNILNLVEKFCLGEYRASNLNSFRLYGTSNENINGYLDFFQLDNRSLCTIGSSFDHSINASFKNPISIIIADINDFGFNIGSNVVWLSNVFDYLKNDEIIFKRIVKDKQRMYELGFDTKCYNIVGARSCEKGDDFVLIYTK